MTLDSQNLDAARAFKPSPANVTLVSAGGSILPSFTSLSIESVLKMDLRGYQIAQKMDGKTAIKIIDGFDVVGEQMADGRFFAFDVRTEGALRERWGLLAAIVGNACDIVPCGEGAAFVESIFSNPDAEGIVLKNWLTPFATDWAKCKRIDTFDVMVTGKVRGAIEIQFENKPAGKCALSGMNYDLVQVGNIVEIAALRRNVSGKFREPRFVRIHHSKN